MPAVSLSTTFYGRFTRGDLTSSVRWVLGSIAHTINLVAYALLWRRTRARGPAA